MQQRLQQVGRDVQVADLGGVGGDLLEGQGHHQPWIDRPGRQHLQRFRVQLDEAINPQQGVSVFRPQSQADNAAAPKITIKRKLSDRLSLSAGSTVGVGTAKSNQVNLDYSVNHNVSLTGVFTSYGASTGTADPQPSQMSLGVDLKFQKRFK